MAPERVAVDAPTRAPDGRTAAYVVGDRDVLVIDPAAPDSRLESALAGAERGHVAVTHHHPDHVGGVESLVESTDPTVWARRGRESAFARATGVTPDRTFLPGDDLPSAEDSPPDGIVSVVDTPGHAPEHVAFGTDRWLCSGDLAVAEGSVVVGGPGADVRAYLTSLRRVHARNPQRLYPAHGPVIDDVRGTCERLLRHRLDRERRVLGAVRDGGRSPDEILDRAYDTDLSGVRDLARATVVAHLRKLAHEGAVAWDGERARPA
jgi:glyoxylase-like metal-dependent hydrolase (beta-lactamase superfamily II)